jgi:hypothetical protein
MMMRKLLTAVVVGVIGGFLWDSGANEAQAADAPLTRFHYYPYYYWPHNYWPTQGPRWPEPPGSPYMRPPAYMAYPPFLEHRWRFELWQPQRYYRGFHFWLDQF